MSYSRGKISHDDAVRDAADKSRAKAVRNMRSCASNIAYDWAINNGLRTDEAEELRVKIRETGGRKP